jgi:hypothetical protein
LRTRGQYPAPPPFFSAEGFSVVHGGETGSTRVVKAWFSPGMVPPLSGQPRSANDNNRLALAA